MQSVAGYPGPVSEAESARLPPFGRATVGEIVPGVKLTIEYIGTAYHGWQIQPGVPTVQGVLQDRLRVILREPVLLAGAARTDAGVHAAGQVASFVTGLEVDPGRLIRSLNAILPGDIAVRRVEPVDETFHARHSATGREYRYQITTGEARSPFLRHVAAHSRRALDVAAMDEAARSLQGRHDFSSFKGAGDRSESAVKEIRSARVLRDDAIPELVRFEVEASGFLQYMVRNIAGTLVEAGLGRVSPSQMRDILAARDRARAGPTAPAHGLCLMRVRYGSR